MLGGGFERGTNVLFIGAAGVGKSSLALSFAHGRRAAGRARSLLRLRRRPGDAGGASPHIGLPVPEALESGCSASSRSILPRCRPASSPQTCDAASKTDHAGVVVIDSLNGYLNAMPDGRFLILQMHELLTYLNQQGVLTILVLAQHGLVGPMETPLDISYLSDGC